MTSPSQSPAPTTPTLSPVIILRVFMPFALGYFLSYTYRTVNAVIAPDLVAELGLNADVLGLLTSAYFLSFAAFQLPLGILLDHYGPRRVEAALLLFAALGAWLFAVAENIPALIVARGLIGFGVSACLMASFKAYVMWFPKEKLPLINGFQLMAGGMGALVATQPVEALLTLTDWRGVFLLLGGVTVFSALMIFFVVPDGQHKHGNAKFIDAVKGVGTVFSSPLFWRVAPITVMSQATFLSTQSLWTGPWMRDVAGMGRDDVAFALLLIATSMVFGFLFWGAAAERLGKKYKIRPLSVGLVGMTLFSVVQGVLIMAPTDIAVGAWMAFGFFGTSGILSYAALSQSFPHNLAGRVNTGLNLLAFVMAFAGQWLTGIIINMWSSETAGYAPEGYAWAFATLMALQILTLAWYVIYRKGGQTQHL